MLCTPNTYHPPTSPTRPKFTGIIAGERPGRRAAPPRQTAARGSWGCMHT